MDDRGAKEHQETVSGDIFHGAAPILDNADEAAHHFPDDQLHFLWVKPFPR